MGMKSTVMPGIARSGPAGPAPSARSDIKIQEIRTIIQFSRWPRSNVLFCLQSSTIRRTVLKCSRFQYKISGEG
jgi:hypothetical protein